MEISKSNYKKYAEKLQKARFSLMRSNPFYAVLLMHVSFGIDDYAETAYTNGKMIIFSPDFLDKLSLEEVEFILMHEVMHIALNHCNRLIDGLDLDLFNYACDIVVNSNILHSFNGDVSKITLKEYGESIHLNPNNEEGYKFNVEEVYKQLLEVSRKNRGNNIGDNSLLNSFDDHSYWENKGDESSKHEWIQNLIEAKKIQDKITALSNKPCNLSLLLERQIDEYMYPKVDWREILFDFIQVEINDYSFNPPDKRFQGSNVILPDFNVADEKIKNIWFVIDTSGSINEDELTLALSEIKGAIEQFNNHLEAYIFFFEGDVTKPKLFTSIEEFKEIKPIGGGGTSFTKIFSSIEDYFLDELPSSIVILTDGYAKFPKEEERKNIPVLWLINNEEVTPLWGKVGRIKLNEQSIN